MIDVSWSFDPTVDGGLAGIAAGYVWLARGRLDRRTAWFGIGLLVVWVALESPLDSLGDEYLLSAHTFQHLVLAMLAPALLLLGLSPAMARHLLRRVPGLAEVVEPMPAMVVSTTVMIAWQAPALYGLTFSSEPLHVFEHLSMMAAGTIFWWPVVWATSRESVKRLEPRAKAAYMSMMALPLAAFSLVLVLAGSVFYGAYATAPRLAGWLSPLTDQRLAGAAVMVLGVGSILGTTALLRRRESRPAARAGNELQAA
ncbi:MAG: cytochrome c oxidase assembly protein [Candidatus Dormibacterales bacterium]